MIEEDDSGKHRGWNVRVEHEHTIKSPFWIVHIVLLLLLSLCTHIRMKCLFLISNEIKKEIIEINQWKCKKKLISCSAIKFISLPQQNFFYIRIGVWRDSKFSSEKSSFFCVFNIFSFLLLTKSFCLLSKERERWLIKLNFKMGNVIIWY